MRVFIKDDILLNPRPFCGSLTKPQRTLNNHGAVERQRPDDLAGLPCHGPGRPEDMGASQIPVSGHRPTHSTGCQRHMQNLGLCQTGSSRLENHGTVGRRRDHASDFAWLFGTPRPGQGRLLCVDSHRSADAQQAPASEPLQRQRQLGKAASGPAEPSAANSPPKTCRGRLARRNASGQS